MNTSNDLFKSACFKMVTLNNASDYQVIDYRTNGLMDYGYS